MHGRRVVHVRWLVLLVLIVTTGVVSGDTPAPLVPLQFLLGAWDGIADQAGATGGFTLH
jgi:hypothetical protein